MKTYLVEYWTEHKDYPHHIDRANTLTVLCEDIKGVNENTFVADGVEICVGGSITKIFN